MKINKNSHLDGTSRHILTLRASIRHMSDSPQPSTSRATTAMAFVFYLLLSFVVLAANGAPRSRSRSRNGSGPTATYDQKQAGEYNIQLHLKDFQIIAVVGDDAFPFGDYDYNYEYSDFTIKPQPGSTTTKKPENATTTSPPTSELISATTQAGTATPTSTVKETTSEGPSSVPGQIPVIVQDFNIPAISSRKEDKKVEVVTNVAIVASEAEEAEDLPQGPPALGEILHYRRCAQGFTRDKRGRCRKIRRPSSQIPLGITRFASNLASRFRPSTPEETPDSHTN